MVTCKKLNSVVRKDDKYMKYVMSDIHGNLKNWNSIMKQIKLKDDDDLYILGDAIDGHPNGIKILRQIMKMKNVHMLLGNHELMMLNAIGYPYDIDENIINYDDAVALWYYNRGKVTHKQFMALTPSERWNIISFLRTLPLNISTEIDGQKFKLCHATIEELYDAVELTHDYSKASFCTWNRSITPVLSELEDWKIVFGHTPTIYFNKTTPLEIYKNGSIIGIDCGSGFSKKSSGGRLACVRLDDMAEFYSK